MKSAKPRIVVFIAKKSCLCRIFINVLVERFIIEVVLREILIVEIVIKICLFSLDNPIKIKTSISRELAC